MRNVREAAAVALWRLGSRMPERLQPALAELRNHPIVEQVADMVASRDNLVRQAGIFLLGQSADGPSVRTLLGLLEDQTLARQAADTLVAIGRDAPQLLTEHWPAAENRRRIYLSYLFGEARCPGSIQLLREGLVAEDSELRQSAARSLGLLGDSSALQALIEALDDEDEAVREALVLALNRLGEVAPAAVLEALLPLLDREEAQLRTSAVRVLGRLDGEQVDRALGFALKDEAAAVRRAAIRSLQGRSGGGEVQSLMLALTDEDVEVRRLAAEVLGDGRNPDFFQPLALALQDDDIWVRATAVRSLGRLETREALDLVRKALKDPVGLVVIAVLETLCDHQPDLAVASLVPALGHAGEEVVNSALQLLLSRGDESWVEARGEQLLNHASWEVRLAAVRAISQIVGPAAIPQLEARLLIEGEDLVRQEIEDLIGDLKQVQG